MTGIDVYTYTKNKQTSISKCKNIAFDNIF